MSRPILIIGANGMLGLAILHEFSNTDKEVIAWDRGDVDVSELDFSEKIKDINPEIIINTVGYNAVDKAEIDNYEKSLAFKINREAPRLMAEIAKELDSIFVTYSTDFVFAGDKKSGIYKEDDTPRPLNQYGLSKFEGEKKVIDVGGKFYIIRPSRIFGKRGNSSLSKKSFVDIMLKKKDDQDVKVVKNEFGSPTYAPDLALFTCMLIDKQYPFGIYHGSNTGICNHYEWAKEIFRLVQSKIVLIPISSAQFNNPAIRPEKIELLNTKTPLQRSWQEALKEFLNS